MNIINKRFVSSLFERNSRYIIRAYSVSIKNANYDVILFKKNIELRPNNAFIIPSNYGKLFSTTKQCYEIFTVQDEDDFQKRVIDSTKPVIVDFYANWCGPCKILGPRLESIIGGKGEKVHLAKIDIDKVSDLALEYGVSAVPSVIAIKNGKVLDKFVGLQDEARVDAFVKKAIDE